jgi:hypothetical protein
MSKKKSKKKAVITNIEFSLKNEDFIKAVEKTDMALTGKKGIGKISPTPRQASKFRNKKGVVYKYMKGMIK